MVWRDTKLQGSFVLMEVGMVWYGMVWYGMVWYGMVWYGMVWYLQCLGINIFVV